MSHSCGSRFVFGTVGLPHRRKPAFVSGCPAIPLQQDAGFGCFVSHTLQVGTSIPATLLYFFCECSGELGTVDFGGQVKAVILFLNAICSQAGREPLGGPAARRGRRVSRSSAATSIQSFPTELWWFRCRWGVKSTACVLPSLQTVFFFLVVSRAAG